MRHIPITPETFKPWEVTDLAKFDSSEPTWKMATPHNIQRWTLRTEVAEGETCSASCHNSDYYLTVEDVEYYKDANGADYGFDDLTKELQANQDVIIME